MTTIVRRPIQQITLDGIVVPNVLSAICSYGLDIPTSKAEIVVPALPSWARKWGIIQPAMGPSPQQKYHRFTGFYLIPQRNLYPRGVTMVCYGPLIKADRTINHVEGGTDMSNAGAGTTDQTQVEAVLDACGLTVAYLASIGASRYIEGTGKVLGTSCFELDDDGKPIGPFTWRQGESGLDYIQRLDHATHCRTYESFGGLIVRVPMSAIPASTPVFTFTEGVNIFSASEEEDILQVQNRISITGYAPPDGPAVYAVRSQLSPWVDGYEPYDAPQNAMLEKAEDADPGSGLSCGKWGDLELIERNRELINVPFSTPEGGMMGPGQTVRIEGAGGVADRLGVAANFWLQHVDCRLDADGWTQDGKAQGGRSSSAPVDPNPLPDFSIWCDVEPVVIGVVETLLYTIYCEAAALGLSGEISDWAWTAVGGTPSSGSGRTFVTSFTDVAGKSIGLQVTDEHGKTGTRSKDIPPATDPKWVRRRLYLAGTGRMEAWDGATWRTYAPTAGDVTVVGNGPFANAAGAILKTLDDLATDASEIACFDGEGEAMTAAPWIERDVSTSMLLAGSSAGRIAVSYDTGSTWTVMDGPISSPVLRCIINRELSRQWWVLTTVGVYQTIDGGAGWEPLLAAEAGETFRDLCISHSRWMVAMSGGRLLCDMGGVAQLVPTLDQGGVILDPPITDVIAVTADIVEDRFYCYDSHGRTFYHDSDGSTMLEAGAPLPAGVVAQPRGLWRDGMARGILYLAGGTGGCYKSLDGLATAAGFFQIRKPGTGSSPIDAVYTQIGADGLLVAAPVAVADLYVSDGRIMLLTSLSPSGYEFREGGLPEGYSCSCLTSDCGDKTIMYALVGGDIYKSTDAGHNWTLNKSFTGTIKHVYANRTVAGEVWCAVADGGTENGIYRSTDYGANWSQVLAFTGDITGGWSNGYHVTAVDTRVWATLHSSYYGYTYLRTSEDGGDNWTNTGAAHDIYNPGRDTVHSQCVGVPDKGVIYSGGISKLGPIVTTDNWATIANRNSSAGSGNALVYSPDGSYMLLSKGGDGIYRSTDNGASFTEMKDTASSGGGGPLLIDFDGNTAYIGGIGGWLFYSTDMGFSWQSVQIDRHIGIVCVHVAQEVS